MDNVDPMEEIYIVQTGRGLMHVGLLSLDF